MGNAMKSAYGGESHGEATHSTKLHMCLFLLHTYSPSWTHYNFLFPIQSPKGGYINQEYAGYLINLYNVTQITANKTIY